MKIKHRFLEKFYERMTFPHQWPINKKTLKKIKRKYGIDIRDCWNLDFAFYVWLYEHVKAYEKFAPVDMDDTKSTHDCRNVDCKLKYKGQCYTQRELMHKLLSRLELCFKHCNDIKPDEQTRKKMNEVIAIWQTLMPCMWW